MPGPPWSLVIVPDKVVLFLLLVSVYLYLVCFRILFIFSSIRKKTRTLQACRPTVFYFYIVKF